MQTKQISIIGAGLVGSLWAIYLRRQGHQVTVFERRPDLRNSTLSAGKSINLALSNRGWQPLKEVGLQAELEKMIIPMKGRMMHDVQGNLTFQPYGKAGQAINSISRGGLNALLMNKAEALGAQFKFEHKCVEVDLAGTSFTWEHKGNTQTVRSDYIFGTDGAFSAVRAAMQKTDRFNYCQSYIPHGYKELVIPPTATGGFAIDKNALHIWPRGEYMLIALPNLDASFTVTLFLPFEGQGHSFASLHSDARVMAFFKEVFPDVLPHMPTLLDDFNAHPAASLVTVKCNPWVKNQTMLLGDAAHAVVPFYGQGMNCGFEDCFELNKILQKHPDNWEHAFAEFNSYRPTNANAIADLAIENFVEMRDRVADKQFLIRKKIEAELHERFPDKWIPQYSMVTFNEDISYAEAMETGSLQKQIMDKVMAGFTEPDSWNTLNYDAIVEALEMAKANSR